jgi:hypothetical protein
LRGLQAQSRSAKAIQLVLVHIDRFDNLSIMVGILQKGRVQDMRRKQPFKGERMTRVKLRCVNCDRTFRADIYQNCPECIKKQAFIKVSKHHK